MVNLNKNPQVEKKNNNKKTTTTVVAIRRSALNPNRSLNSNINQCPSQINVYKQYSTIKEIYTTVTKCYTQTKYQEIHTIYELNLIN